MKRRAFLGFLGGAAAAGPVVAKEALTKGSLSDLAGGVPAMGAPPMGYPHPIKDDGSWKFGRIAELKKLITGKDPEAAHQSQINRLYAMETFERARLDTLRSVSLTSKLRMLQDGAPKRQERISREHWKRELAQLLKIGG